MFIRKKDYKKLCKRIEAIENAFPTFRKATDEALCGFATDIEELQGKVKSFEEEAEAVSKDREIEKAFIDGFSNIMNYEVGNGRGKTQ